jgi:hypothetical protein
LASKYTQDELAKKQDEFRKGALDVDLFAACKAMMKEFKITDLRFMQAELSQPVQLALGTQDSDRAATVEFNLFHERLKAEQSASNPNFMFKRT